MLIDKVKSIFNKTQEGDSKKKMENLVVFIIILIVTLIVINVIWKSEKKENKDTSNDQNKKLASLDTNIVNNTNAAIQDTLTLQLEEILEKIDGVGNVKVLITYSQTNETIPMYNEDTSQKDTEEKDTSRRNKKSN